MRLLSWIAVLITALATWPLVAAVRARTPQTERRAAITAIILYLVAFFCFLVAGLAPGRGLLR